MTATDDRIDRLEERVDLQQTEIHEVATNVAWIKGYLEKHPVNGVPVFRRDAGMVAGGGGLAGSVIWMLERLFGG